MKNNKRLNTDYTNGQTHGFWFTRNLEIGLIDNHPATLTVIITPSRLLNHPLPIQPHTPPLRKASDLSTPPIHATPSRASRIIAISALC